MPTRLVREGYLSSAAVDKLDAQAERFYFRLYLVVDDYGRYEFRPELIKSSCFPVKTSVRVSDITRWIAACVRAGLIVIYEHGGREYLCVLKFGQRTRRASTCPAPPGETPMTAECGLGEGVFEDEGVGVAANETARSPSGRKSKPPPKNLSFDPIAIWCEEYKRVYHANPRIDGPDSRECHRMGELAKDGHEWRWACRAYLEDHTPFVVSKGHGMQWFKGSKDRYFRLAQEYVQNDLEKDEYGSDDQTGLESELEAARLAKNTARPTAI